ncbi:MAG TPA: tetratricopeptide repeat protein [Vicinamibacterales bacterium]|nr:tetratricopeptide repeat protein [Vicinamibacterales bacterium]
MKRLLWCAVLWIAAPAAAEPAVTFTRDIAPLLYARCVACHQPGGAAPFSLITYADARQRAALIARVTKSRYMPPWKPDTAGFIGDRRLTDAQIATFGSWVDSGTPEGAAADLPPAPRLAPGWQSGPPDLVVTLPSYVVRGDGPDIFRNFVVAVPGEKARLVRGLEFRPGSRAVHHANIRIDPTPASRQLDEADPEPGYEGVILRSADYPDGHFLGWTPGQAPPIAAEDMAWTLDAGSDFVVQLHIRPTGKQERIQPSLGLYFASTAPSRSPSIVRLGRQNLDIPPGADRVSVTDSFTLPVDVEVRAIQPHAHYRARTMEVTATLPSGARRPLIAINQWDFNWQDQYHYAAPVWLPAGTRIDMAYVFDNSDANPRNPDHPPQRVSWGWRSSDEMADVWIQVMTRSDDDRRRLATVSRRKMAAEDAIGCETIIAREPDYAAVRNDAAALYLELGQPDAALRHFEAVRRLQPQSAVAHYNVGVALEAMKNTAAAAQEYEAAVRLDPQYSAAHNNLGNIRLAERRLDAAMQEYLRAVESAPTNVEAQNNLGAVRVATGNAAGAIQPLETAIRLRFSYPEAHFNLARAYGAVGRAADAHREAAIAEQQAIEAGKTDLAAAIRALRRRPESNRRER